MRFRNKVILGFLVVVLINAVVLSVGCKFLLKPIFINDTKKKMEIYGAEVEEVLEESDDEILDLLTSINVDYAIQVYVLDPELNVMYTHLGDRTRIGRKSKKRIADMLESYRATKEETYIAEHNDISDNYKRLYYIRQLKDGHYIIMCRAIRGIDQDISIVTRFLYVLILILSACCLVLWYGLTRGFTRRMESMSRVTRKMSQLDFDEKVNYRGNDEIGILAESIDDLSDKLQKSINRMQDELERREELIRNVAHELRTPITSIRGYSEQMQAVLKGDANVKRFSDIIIEECDSLDLLAGEMLELSAIEDEEEFYKKETIPTKEFFDTVRQRSRRLFPEAEIVYQCESQTLYGNKYLLERAILNYLANAVKYGTPGEQIRLDGYADGGYYVFAVTNCGDEIPPAEQEKIWDAFYRRDKSRKRCGSYGIGLSIVRKIAALHRGDTAVECKDGKTVFTFRVPLTQ